MKQIGLFLQKIHSLPEEVRRFLAILCMAIAAIIVFNGWGWMISSRLQTLSETSAIAFREDQNPATNPYPAAREYAPQANALVSREKTPSIFGQIGSGIDSLSASLGIGVEKVLKYIFEPFQ